jgi:hypothetical protein
VYLNGFERLIGEVSDDVVISVQRPRRAMSPRNTKVRETLDGRGYSSLKQSQPYRPRCALLGCDLFLAWQILDQVPDDGIHRNTYL